MSLLSLTLIQTELYWEDKEKNLAMVEKKIEAVQSPTQVIILPEMFSTGFSMNPEKLAENMDGPTVQWMKKIAASKKIILTGSIIVEDGGQYFNRLIWMQPNGQDGFYDKRHLFAYGKEDQHYTAGTRRLIASVNGWKINLMVCYDLRFPVWSRQQTSLKDTVQTPSLKGKVGMGLEYDVLIYIANWPEKRNTAWKILLQARAIENQCYVIGVNRVGNDGNNIYHSGDSMVIDPLGEILYHKAHDEDLFTIDLDNKHLQEIREKFQFLRDADNFKIII